MTHRLAFRWTLGSALFLASFAAVMGPVAYAQHLLSGPRLPFTAAYFGSITLTLYFSMGVSLFSVSVDPVRGACCGTGRMVADIGSLTASTAPQHDPYPLLCNYPAGRLGMVPRQLLPHGPKRLACGYLVWR